MPQPNRQQAVAQAIQARRPRATGGVSAPRSAAKGPTTGLGRARVAPSPGKVGQARPLPGGGRATVGSGVPAPAPGPTPTPWSARYEQTVAGARKRYLNADTNFDLAETTAKQDFGLDPGFNDFKVNPNSRAAQLEQSYQQTNRGVMNSAGLQLYSGSTSNRLGSNRSAYGTSRHQLASAYQEALGEINQGRAEAAERQAEEEQRAYWDRVGEAEASEPEALAAPGKSRKPKRKAQPRVAVARAIVAPKGKGKRR